MSQTVDQRVVEMRFDNKNFESNVRTSMGTLEKLKRSLKLDNAAKGLENVNTAAKRVNLNPIGSAVETVQARFSAMQIAGITAMTRITNAAITTGKRMISALTIDPVKTGFQEYETQMNSVQTILANTQSKGSTLDDVNNALEALNKYADQTIYNFTEMTRNIGTFTAAGVDLQTSVDSIKGIANLAAVSGSSSQQASTAMYQLSQALAAGKVSLMDWNSVVNAGMGGELFQNALIRTSELLKTGAKDAIATYGSFRESLTQGEWLTTEVLTETLKQLSGAYSEADLIAQGFTKEQAKEIRKLADTAVSAATEVKTFTQLWDVLKESAQSGWSQTWKLIVGDFEEAKAILSPLADFLTGIIGSMSDFRNKILESALGRGFSSLGEKIKSVVNPAAKAMDTVKGTVKVLSDLDEIASKVIKGEFGNGKDRFDALTEAGQNYYRVQNKVNETLGDSFRYTKEQIEAQDKILGTQTESTDKTKEQTKATAELNDEQKKQIVQLALKTDEQLKALGYDEAQIEAFRELRKQADALGMSTTEFIDKLDQINGRWLLIESFKNIGKGVIEVFNAMKTAWQDVFPPKSVEERATQLFNLISAIHKFTRGLVGAIYQNGQLTETGDKLVRTMKGVFAVIDLIATITGGGLRIAFKLLTHVLSYFNMDILDLTASIGDALVNFRDWFDSIFDITGALDVIGPAIEKAIGAIKNWFTALKDTDIAQDLIEGLKIGITEGIPKIGAAIVELAKNMVDKVKSFLGIHSPSTVFIAIGAMVIAGLVKGLLDGDSEVFAGIRKIVTTLRDAFVNGFDTAKTGIKKFIPWLGDKFSDAKDSVSNFMTGSEIGDGFSSTIDTVKSKGSELFESVKSVVSKIAEFLSGIDWGAVIGLSIIVGILVTVNRVINAAESFADAFGGFSKAFESVGDGMKNVLDAVAGKIKASTFVTKTEGILNLAKAIALLAGSMVLLANVPWPDIGKGLAAMAGLAVIIGVLAFALSKFNPGSFQFGANAFGLAALVASLLLMALAVSKLGTLNEDELKRGLGAITLLAIIMAGLIVFANSATGTGKVGGAMLAMSIAIILMTHIAKKIGEMDPDVLKQGVKGIAAFGLIIAGLIAITRLAGGNAGKVAATILGVSLAILMLVGVAKLIASIPGEELAKGIIGITAFGIIISGLIFATRLAGGNLVGIGSTILGVGAAMLLLAFTARILGSMSAKDLFKGILATTALGGIVTGLIAATKLAGPNVEGLAKTVMGIAVAIAILAAVATILGFMSIEHLAKGVIATGLLSGMMALMIKATKGARRCLGNLIAMTVAIAVMAAAVLILYTLDDLGKLARSVAAVSILMGMFALMIKATSALGGATWKSVAILGVMVLVVGALAAVVWGLSKLPVESALPNAAALGILLLAMSGVTFILSKMATTIGKALIGALALASLVIPMAAFLGMLCWMAVIPQAHQNALLLVRLMAAMTTLLVVLTFIGVCWIPALAGVGCLLSLVVPIAAFLGMVCWISAIDEAKAKIDMLVELMESMTNLLIDLAAVGSDALLAAASIAILTDTMVDIAKLAVTFGWLMEQIPGVEEFLYAGLPILKHLAEAIGEMAGLMVTGFINELDFSNLITLGTQLSDFMNELRPFLNGLRVLGADDAALTGAKSLASIIMSLTWADILHTFASSFEGGGLPQLGSELSAFMTNAWPFFVMATMIKPETFTGVKALADALITLTGSQLLAGLTSLVTGGYSMAEFGAQIGLLADGLVTFANNLGDLDDTKLQSVEYAAKAIKALAEAASSLPKEGGLWAELFGENSLATFAQKLPLVGTYLYRFAANLGTFGEDQITTIECACRAIAAMAEASKSINGQADWAKALFGDNSLTSFGSELAAFGGQLASFVSRLGTFGKEQLATVNSAVKAIGALAGLAEADLKNAIKNLDGFGEQLPPLAGQISSFVNLMPAGESISAACTGLNYLIALINNIADAKTADLAGFTESLGSIGTDGVAAFVEAFSGSSALTKVKAAAGELMDNAIEALGKKKSGVRTAMGDAAKAGAESAKNKRQAFYDAGLYLVKGFCAGISENTYLAEAKAAAMANAAEKSAKEALDVNSPSKVFRAIGKSVPEGFAQGVGMLGSMVKNSATSMTDTAVSSVSKSIANLSNMVSSDIDTQPTIRPVIDLNNVQYGLGQLDSMLGMGRSIGVSANVGAISSMMNTRSQNGANADVVTAIDKLRTDLSNMDHATYNVNGITYDDGSNITSAVQTLVRAAKIERRV